MGEGGKSIKNTISQGHATHQKYNKCSALFRTNSPRTKHDLPQKCPLLSLLIKIIANPNYYNIKWNFHNTTKGGYRVRGKKIAKFIFVLKEVVELRYKRERAKGLTYSVALLVTFSGEVGIWVFSVSYTLDIIVYSSSQESNPSSLRLLFPLYSI